MAGLSGSGSRARKKLRKQPATRAALKRARRRFCKAKRAICDIEQGAHLSHPKARGRAPIVARSIFPSTDGCTYFVQEVPSAFKHLRYRMVALCAGGRDLKELGDAPTKDEAISRMREYAQDVTQWAHTFDPRYATSEAGRRDVKRARGELFGPGPHNNWRDEEFWRGEGSDED